MAHRTGDRAIGQGVGRRVSSTGTEGPNDGQLLEEAAAWFARMRGPDAEASRAEFEAWLARGALHRSAYNRAAEIFAMGKLLDDTPERPATQVQPRARRPAMAAAIVVVIAGAIGIAATSFLWTGHGSDSDRTGGGKIQLLAIDQMRLVRLADGSLVRLNPGTILDVTFSNNERRSILERGLVQFAVAHEGRPFVVLAGGGSVTAHGTRFDVGLSADRRVSVRLIEGVIDVRLPVAAAARPRPGPVRRLHPGEAISFVAEASGPSQGASGSKVRPMSAPAADRGAEDFDDIRIADLVAAANRHSVRQIRLADNAIGDQLVSGRFAIDEPDLLATRIGALFDLVVDRSDPAVILLERRAPGR